MGSSSLVSVVTPFFNTRQFLTECIESVLSQTYENWEYVLVDNCSSDGSAEIARSYAARFPGKIRLVTTETFLSQVQNYNFALTCISPESKYCKMVQADDWIYPECLARMVALGEANPSIGIICSYYLNGNKVDGFGLPVPDFDPAHLARLISGKRMAQFFLRTRTYVFGTPTTVMYRSSLVRSQQPFYDESLLHEDTEKCMQILQHWDFGFVHEVLSFLRTQQDSITSAARDLEPIALDWYITVQRYAPVFLEGEEADVLKRKSRAEYYSALAYQALQLRDSKFWQYHKSGLKTLGETLDVSYLALKVCQQMLWMVANPGETAGRVKRFLKRATNQHPRASSPSVSVGP